MSFIKVRLTIPNLSELLINPSIQDKDTALSCKPKAIYYVKVDSLIDMNKPLQVERNQCQISTLTSQNFSKPTKLEYAK